jgi:hypothetical protein
MTDDVLSIDEIRELRKLLELEKIRKKRLLFSQLMDSGDLDGLVALYAEDATGDWAHAGTWSGRDAILGKIAVLAGKPTYNWLHMTTNLWIELTTSTVALSRCYFHNLSTEFNPRMSPTVWLGIYEEDWVKIDGDWKIKHQRIHYLWPKREVSEDFPRKMQTSGGG